MTGYDFHPEAEIDLDEIWEFIAQDNPRAADKVTEDILSALSALVSSPHIGHRTCFPPVESAIIDNEEGKNTVSVSITSIPGILGGKPCLSGHRVRVSDIVVLHEHQGLTADAIVSQIPGLTLADVHAALGYYYENLDAIRDDLRAEMAVVDHYETSAASIPRTGLSQARRVS